MEETVLVIAVLGVGYVLGVWTALAVLRQPQREYEDGLKTAPVMVKVRAAISAGPTRPSRRLP